MMCRVKVVEHWKKKSFYLNFSFFLSQLSIFHAKKLNLFNRYCLMNIIETQSQLFRVIQARYCVFLSITKKTKNAAVENNNNIII